MAAAALNGGTSDTIRVDAARLPLLLRELRLPTRRSFTERADCEGWRAGCWPPLAEAGLAERVQRHLIEAHLPPGNTLDTFDSAAVHMVSRSCRGAQQWLSAVGRKSVKPLVEVTAPEPTAAQQQSLLHLPGRRGLIRRF
jgi:hypothetical protein